jgi:hypothetical protein
MDFVRLVSQRTPQATAHGSVVGSFAEMDGGWEGTATTVIQLPQQAAEATDSARSPAGMQTPVAPLRFNLTAHAQQLTLAPVTLPMAAFAPGSDAAAMTPAANAAALVLAATATPTQTSFTLKGTATVAELQHLLSLVPPMSDGMSAAIPQLEGASSQPNGASSQPMEGTAPETATARPGAAATADTAATAAQTDTRDTTDTTVPLAINVTCTRVWHGGQTCTATAPPPVEVRRLSRHRRK